MVNWRDSLPEETNTNINKLIRKIIKYGEAYNQSPHVRTSQLWCVLAELQKEVEQLQERLAKAEHQVNSLKSALRKSGETMAKS